MTWTKLHRSNSNKISSDLSSHTGTNLARSQPYRGAANQYPARSPGDRLEMASPPGRHPGRRKRAITPEFLIALGFGGVALLILGILFIFSLYTLFTFSDVILPGVVVGDTKLGGINIDQAVEKLDLEWNYNKQLVVSDGVTPWLDKTADFGLFLDSAVTAQDAYMVGRDYDGISQFFSIIMKRQWRVMPQVVFNQEMAQAKLQLYTEVANVPPYDASLLFQDGEWTALPGAYGTAIDIEHTISNLYTNRNLIVTSGYFTLTMVPVPPLFEDVSLSLEQIEPLLNSPMNFHAYDPITDENYDWTVEPETFADWIRIEDLAGDPNPVIALGPLQEYLDQWQVELGLDRILEPVQDSDDLEYAWKNGEVFTVMVWYLPTMYQVQAGDMLSSVAYRAQMPYWKILEANPNIDPENLITGDELIIPSRNEMLPLEVVWNKRIKISITSQRLWTYEDGQLLNEYVISTGIDDSPTLPGVYQVQTHEINAYASVWDLYMPHFLGIYEGWPGFMNGIHGLPMLSSGVRLWGGVLGRKASYGCIVMDLASGETVYNWADNGVVVEITP
ncbi:MAG: L,D-transpeptidase family protein [Anaerolineaceae bacterium]|nr:L,D-transpeptidase family protein [Anaerolineaceae bacterium]